MLLELTQHLSLKKLQNNSGRIDVSHNIDFDLDPDIVPNLSILDLDLHKILVLKWLVSSKRNWFNSEHK